MKPFTKKVLEVVAEVSKGKVLTYSQVAVKAGNSQASRAVGSIMAKNTDKKIPCHRVVKSDGSIGMYNGILGKNKETILKKERVRFKENGKVFLA